MWGVALRGGLAARATSPHPTASWGALPKSHLTRQPEVPTARCPAKDRVDIQVVNVASRLRLDVRHLLRIKGHIYGIAYTAG
jgi:hypothetical protein